MATTWCCTSNANLSDFKEHINSIENEVNAFTTKQEWNHKNWIGFFKYLQKELNNGNWGYVPNQNGGFMGYWWAFQKNESCWQYLQIQEDKLVLKINALKPENYTKFRNYCYKYYVEKAKRENLSFKKPVRFGNGETMTILTTEYLVKDEEAKLINIEKTIQNLKSYTDFIEKYALKEHDFVSL